MLPNPVWDELPELSPAGDVVRLFDAEALSVGVLPPVEESVPVAPLTLAESVPVDMPGTLACEELL